MRDAIVVGGGHNALVCAAYLGRAGLDVLVLERLERFGGAAVSSAPFPGLTDRLSRYAYLVSPFPRRIMRDLGVDVELRTRRVAAFAPPGLIVEADASSARTAESFEAVTGSSRDHVAWLEFEALLAAAAARLMPTLTEPLPSRDEARALLADLPGAWQALAERPLGETLAERFDDGLVRGVVSTDGLIGTFASVGEESLRQNRSFLWHVIGGRWRVPVGGMGAIASALEAAASGAGAELRAGAEALRIDHGPGSSEVTWREGDSEHAESAHWILSGVAPATLAALERREPGGPSPEGSQTKVNLLLERLPRLRSGIAPEDAFAGTFRLNEHEDELEAAYLAAAAGGLPERLPAELYCHSLTDPSTVAPGHHSLTLFGLHTPARLFEGRNDELRAELTDRYLDELDEHLEEPIRDCLARDAAGRPCVEAKTPLDVERELGMPGGNIFHGGLDFPWADAADRAGDWGSATGHPRTLLCGSGARRGGCVSGVAGHNAAMTVLGQR